MGAPGFTFCESPDFRRKSKRNQYTNPLGRAKGGDPTRKERGTGMPLQSWKKLSETVLFRNPYWTYKLDALELPGGAPGEYHYVHTNGSSMIVPVTDDGGLLLVKQYRHLAGRESVEFPCGSVKEGRSHEETARDELEEETGCLAQTLRMVGEFNPFNGVTNEMCRVYVAGGLTYVGEKPDETEEFEILRVTPVHLEAWIRTGTIWDGMTIAAWAIAKGASEIRTGSRGRPVEDPTMVPRP